MLRARAGNIVILGLSAMNLERLKDGKPIRFEGDSLGFPGQVFFITYGETEQAIEAELEAAMKPPPTEN